MGFNIEELIMTVGYAGIFGIVFAESGLLFGFIFPGDSLLLTAGILASRNYLNIWYLIPLCIVAAIAGDSVGYWIGRKTGPKIFCREDSLFFHKKNLVKAQEFYEKHGGKTIILARFMPFIRTFAPIVAGVGEMKYARFLFFNIFGGIFWVLLMSLVGYFIGAKVPGADKYLHFLILGVIFVSVLPSVIHVWKEYRYEILKKLKDQISRTKSKGFKI